MEDGKAPVGEIAATLQLDAPALMSVSPSDTLACMTKWKGAPSTPDVANPEGPQDPTGYTEHTVSDDFMLSQAGSFLVLRPAEH